MYVARWHQPGVYELQEGDRITHAIEAAGGLTEAAGQVYLNQAAHLTDGQRIYVPSREEEQTLKEEGSPSDMQMRDGKRHRNNKPEHRDKG